MNHLRKKYKWIVTGFVLLTLVIWYIFSLPSQLFNTSYSLVMRDRNGVLMGAMIAGDGQWRFPHNSEVPEKFEKCILTFEDKRFYQHNGVDVFSVMRAFVQNISSMDRVSGASTITMQVIRLSRQQERSYAEKIIEMILAMRLESSYSKKEILALYASHAPFGGNVVGLEAASWRYYGKPSTLLSWAESATLAVLPNSPSLVHPGKNRQTLLQKRNRLLNELKVQGIIDSTTCELAMLEPLPEKPYPLPSMAPHLLARLYNNDHSGKIYETTLNAALQSRLNEVMQLHHRRLSQNGIYNASALIIDVNSGEVMAYTGNVGGEQNSDHQSGVDNILAPRSTGSVLKPLLYASMLQEGELLPDMLVPDVPTYINHYTPKNFNYEYDGAVPASEALARSLNIPAVKMLGNYGVAKFRDKLQSMGITTMNRSAKDYGLTLILGGGEANLWELSSVYAGMARTLNHYNQHGHYYPNDFLPAHFVKNNFSGKDTTSLESAPVLNASSIWLTFDAMMKVTRPDEERYWAAYASARKIAWKTGTSFGDRDAWAIGCTPQYVVAVWAGNSDGHGQRGLTGIASAAPIMFDIFNLLPRNDQWFKRPVNDMRKMEMCKASGHLASDDCPEREEHWIGKGQNTTGTCPYHHQVHLDTKREYRVHSNCEVMSNMLHEIRFVLPPSMEKYYKKNHADYKELPPYRIDCISAVLDGNTEKSMDLVYPLPEANIYLPVTLEGELSSTVFEAVHYNPSATLFWHLDEELVGITKGEQHQLSLQPKPGKHVLVLVDDSGVRLQRDFTALGRKL